MRRLPLSLLVLLALLAGLTAVAPAATSGPPEVPACYSGSGPCEGIFLKSAGAPIVKSVDSADGTFVLQAPGSVTGVDLVHPVACGDLGCLYNHYNWIPRATVVSGCGANQPTCTVKVGPGGASWAPVLLNLNDYPQGIYLQWWAGAAHQLSGQVIDSAGQPVAGATITATGPATLSATTGADGRYAITGAPGVYAVVPSIAAQGSFAPDHATADLTNADATQSFTFTRRQPSLTVALSPTVPPGGLGVGDTLTVPVTVTAGATAVSAISLGGGLTVAGSAVAVSRTPDGTGDFSLAAGESRTFAYEVTAQAAGQSTLAAAADGTAEGGGSVHVDGSTSFPVATKDLAITMAPTPAKVTLEADDKGKIAPKTIKVRVRLTNTTKARLTSVQLLSLSPVPADPTEQLDQLAFAKKDLPVKIGTIEGGASKVKTFSLKVTGDGKYIIKALALYADPTRPGGNGRATAQGGAFTVLAPLLYFKADLDKSEGAHGDQVTVKGGGSWYVTGHVKNLSSFQTLCLSPLNPSWQGNAGGLGPHQIGVVGVDDPAPPLAGTLAPGKTISFLLRADTSGDGGTRSGVALKPRATRGKPGDACNVLATDRAPALKAAEVKIASDSDAFSVHVDLTGPGPAGAGALEFFGAYAKGSYKVLSKIYEGGVSLATEYGSVDQLVAALQKIDPEKGLERAEAALSSMMHAGSLAAQFWIEATPEERQAVLGQISDDFAAKSHAVWDGVQGAVQHSAEGWFDSVVRAYYDGDTTSMFKALGGSAGEGLTESAIEMAKFELGLALLKKTAKLAKVLTKVAGESRVIGALREMPVGKILTFEEMQKFWGLAKGDFDAFTRIAKEEGVLIGVRGRAVVSVKNLEEGAVWKHENLKPKNVNSIDTRFLEFAEEDSGLVAFRTYTFEQKQTILQRIANSSLDAEQKAAAVDRAHTRFGESKYLRKIEGMAKDGEIDVGFNYRDNGLDVASTSSKRTFALEAKDLKGGGVYYRPLQENVALDALAGGTESLPAFCKRQLAKVLCRVTGDMDGVYLTDTAGGALSEAKRLAVYQRLAAFGWQHPETLTWINDAGEFFFSAKKKILAGLELGGEPMMEFAPDGIVRATYLNLKRSKLLSQRNYFINILGGYTALR